MTQQPAPAPRDTIMEISAYVPGTHAVEGHAQTHRLSSNETPLGASPRAIEAATATLASPELYPDGSASALRAAIGARYGLNANHIICGAGSDELISLIAQTYLMSGDEAIHTAHGFLMYRIATLAAGGSPVVAAESDFSADVDTVLSAVSSRTRIVYLANPNNPTGTYIPVAEVRRLHAGLPPNVLLVLDAAYAEYVRRNDYEAGIELAATQSNVIMTRTFSKIHGLAGLRIGWAYGPESVIDALNRVRGPFNIGAPSIAAGAAAIADQSFVDTAIDHNDTWLPWVTRKIEALGLSVTPSVGNFILIHFPEDDGKRASEADRYLLDRGIILRRVGAYGLPNALRMTIGQEDANRAVVDALAAFLGSRAD